VGLTGYLAVLRRRWLALALCVVAGLAGAAAIVATTHKAYRANSTLFIEVPKVPLASSVADQVQAQQAATDYIHSFEQLAQTDTAVDAIAAELQVSRDLVKDHVSAKAINGTFYLQVTATSRQPDTARILADAAASVMVQQIPQLQKDQPNPVLARLWDRAREPSGPYQPRPKTTLAVGGGLGLVVGIALIVLLEALDRTLRGAEQASSLTGAPLLGTIPRRRGAGASRLIVSGTDAEPYRGLRTAVQFLDPDSPPQVLLVTSPSPGDGKSTTAANLAAALADSGQRVLLVDGDLRRGQLTRTFGVEKAPGLSSLVTRTAGLRDVLLEQGQVMFLPTGPLPPNPSEILGSQAAADVLAEIRTIADIIVIDAAPVLAVTDAVVLARQTDAVLLVVRHGATPRAGAADARRQLEAVAMPAAGVVLNAVPRSEGTGYYGEYLYVAPTLRQRLTGRAAS
jgi:capsular exopolysaccharide synthesis family protein